MYRGYCFAFWGVVVATILVPIGWIEAIFVVAGMLLIAYGLRQLDRLCPEPAFRTARRYCYLAAAWTVLSETLAIIAKQHLRSVHSLIPVVLLLFAFCEHMVVHHLLEGSVHYLNRLDRPDIPERNERDLKKYTIVFSINTAIEIIGTALELQVLEIIAMVGFLMIRAWLLVMIGRMKHIAHRETELPQKVQIP